MINKSAFVRMKSGARLINTGRGGLCNTSALIAALESGKLGYAGLDVYEKERDLFFVNHHGKVIYDEQFLKLQSLSNVIITPHQAFLTKEAVSNITAFEQVKIINQIG